MLRYAKLGNIKIGGSVNGLPKRYNKIFLTKSYKDNGENFVKHPAFENGVNELKVRLPFVFDLRNTFDASLTSFISICGYKYLIKATASGNIIGFPLQESDSLGRVLPSINFGAIDEGNIARLNLSHRILLTLFVMNESGTDYLDSKNGVYLFKTVSKNTFYDIDNTLRLISTMNQDMLRLVNFTLELHTKTVQNQDGESEDLSYVRLLPPSQEEIIKAYELLQSKGNVLLPIMSSIETAIVNSRNAAIENALNESSTARFFNVETLNIEFLIDEFEQQVSVSEAAKKERTKKEVSKKRGSKQTLAQTMIEAGSVSEREEKIKEQAKELFSRFPNIKETVIASLINNFGLDEAIVILENNPTLPQVIAEISKRKIPEVD